MTEENVILLGATGSIGQQTIDVISSQPRFRITAVSLASDIAGLEKELPCLPYLRMVGIKDSEKALAFSRNHKNLQVISGSEINIRLASSDIGTAVVNALSGAAGYLPSLAALRTGKDLCLANKESLVIGGSLIKKELAAGHGRLYAIDSEHSALAKLLSNARREDISRLIITASGGSLRDFSLSELKHADIKAALRHPTWKMGPRITVDSATMVNKGFELVEASWLFDWPREKIDVLINDESQIHAGLEMTDGSYIFEAGPSDMRIPISYALNRYRRVPNSYPRLDLVKTGALHFRPFDKARYPLFGLVGQAAKEGKTALAYLNAADEKAIEAFAAGLIDYGKMTELIADCYQSHPPFEEASSPEAVMRADLAGREVFSSVLKKFMPLF